jgi:uncharacterized membrane protein HdeD (DUF308 family)
MNKLLKRAGNAWLIFIKNKVAGAVMMLISGIMMFIAAINGKGNDTKTLPFFILLAGAIFAFWGFYRIGYIKSNYESAESREEKQLERRVLISQIGETLLYLIVAALGVFLLMNESFTDKILNLMAGGFTILNGVFGILYILKHKDNKNFGWKFRIGLTIVEFAMGIYFIFASDSIGVSSYAVLGSITTIAGIIEVFHAMTRQNLEDAVRDGKDMIKAFKDDSVDEDGDGFLDENYD